MCPLEWLRARGGLFLCATEAAESLRDGLNPQVEMLCAEHKRTARACEGYGVTETDVEGKGAEFLLFDVALEAQRSGTVSS